MKRFDKRAVYVTGAGSGVGRATAQRFAAEGAHVFAADVNAQGVAETVEAVRAQGGRIDGGTCDVASWDSVQGSITEAAAAMGGLNVLVNAAGIGRTVRLEEMDVADWQKTIAVNLTGPFHTTKAALPHLLRKKGNSIVNVASIAGVRGQAYASHYAASKAGLVNFTKAVALEFASRGLRANCVCPGGVLTPMVSNFQPVENFEPQLIYYFSPPVPGVFSSPEDVAGVIAFLASDDARRVSGAALLADSGTLA